MSSSRRSPIVLSPRFAPGDYNTNLVIAVLGMLEIGHANLTTGDHTSLPTSFPSTSPVSRSTRLYYCLRQRHQFRLPGRYKRNVGRYTLIDGKVFCHSYTHLILTCVSGDQCACIMAEFHEGICGSHVGGRTLSLKVVELGLIG